jgi:hypothetical protein
VKVALKSIGSHESEIIGLMFGIGYPKCYTRYDIARVAGLPESIIEGIKIVALGKLQAPKVKKQIIAMLRATNSPNHDADDSNAHRTLMSPAT